ncbi:MAG: type II toxin-antitoxin system RelE/ParE family toxin [Nitrosomonas sp.]|nr:type II toxin-antitoxin system RelE/ParE family toxin [Nitrosomonas sp.]
MRFKVSKEVREDIRKIGRYTQRKWSKDQRRNYLNDLDKKFGLLAENPLLGRRCDSIREGYFWFEYVLATLFFTDRKKTL